MTLAVPFTEYVETVSPSSASFGRDETRMAVVYDVPFSKIEDGTAVQAILGYNWINPLTGSATPLNSYPPLTRIAPMRCPMFPWLYATKITSCQFWPPAPGNQITTPQYFAPPGNSPDFPNVRLPRSINPADATLDPYTVYKTARLTVLFETLPYDVMSDAQVLVKAAQTAPVGQPPLIDEYYRWTLHLPVANVEQIIRPGNTFRFANGPRASPTFPYGDPFPQGLVVRAQKRDLVVKWFGVPAAALLDIGQLNPLDPLNMTGEPWTVESSILATRVGTVNNAPWHGYRRGEVLLKPSRVEPVQEPLPPAVLGLPVGAVPRCFNVEYHFQIFQPTYDPAELANRTYATFGHQTAPSQIGNSIYFYQIAANGGNGRTDNTKWLYPETDFSKLFQGVAYH